MIDATNTGLTPSRRYRKLIAWHYPDTEDGNAIPKVNRQLL